jgi:hypothetical protein
MSSSLNWERNPANELRDQVWQDYFKMRDNRVCSRCGNYSRYQVVSKRREIQRELSDSEGHDFYVIDYEIKKTPITNQNSNDSEWGNLCTRCRKHVLGLERYDLESSPTDVETEIIGAKQQERWRQIKQDDEIKKARMAFNKARREKEKKE